MRYFHCFTSVKQISEVQSRKTLPFMPHQKPTGPGHHCQRLGNNSKCFFVSLLCGSCSSSSELTGVFGFRAPWRVNNNRDKGLRSQAEPSSQATALEDAAPPPGETRAAVMGPGALGPVGLVHLSHCPPHPRPFQSQEACFLRGPNHFLLCQRPSEVLRAHPASSSQNARRGAVLSPFEPK